MTQTTPTAEQLVQDFLDIINERDESAVDDVLSESFVMIDPSVPGGEIDGHEGIKALIREVEQGFPDFRIEILDSLASEEVVMVEVRYTGTHEGEFYGLPPTGRRVEFQGMERYRITDGAITDGRVYISEKELKEELGLTFPEVIGQIPTSAWGKLQTNL